MAEQARDEELDMDFFYSDKVKSPNQDEIRSYRFLTHHQRIIKFWKQ